MRRGEERPSRAQSPLDTPARTAEDWDRAWEELSDFMRLHPGARHRRRLITEVVLKEPCNSVIDVGCGRGELLLSLHRHCPGTSTFVGTDFSVQTMKSNRERVSFAEFYGVDLMGGTLSEELAERFDVVVCSEVLEHLPDWRVGFRMLGKFARSGGRIVVTTPGGRIYRLERDLFGHLCHPTAEDYVQQAAIESFEVLSVSNWGWPLYRALKWATNIFADQAASSFAYTKYSAWQKIVCEVLYRVNFLNLRDHPWGCQRVIEFRKR